MNFKRRKIGMNVSGPFSRTYQMFKIYIFLSTRKHFEYKYNKSRTIRSNSSKVFLNCRQNIQPIIKNKKGDIILKDTKYLQLHVYAK